jgi:hypothetical protein
MAARSDLGDVALAIGVTAYETARIPLGLLVRLPGTRRLAQEGALARLRLRSAVEGRLSSLLCAPEVERAVDRVLAETLPDAIARALREHEAAARAAAEPEPVAVAAVPPA